MFYYIFLSVLFILLCHHISSLNNEYNPILSNEYVPPATNTLYDCDNTQEQLDKEELKNYFMNIKHV